jgi:hypothetical protein
MHRTGSPWGTAVKGVAMLADHPAPVRTADREQVQYFNDLLGGRRAELVERVGRLQMQAMKLTRIGEDAGVRNKRRIFRVPDSEAHLIDRMRSALTTAAVQSRVNSIRSNWAGRTMPSGGGAVVPPSVVM